MKKFFKLTFIILLCCVLSIVILPTTVYAAENSEDEIFRQLDENIKNQLDMLDMEELDRLLQELGVDSIEIFGNSSFQDKVVDILDGKFIEDSGSFLEAFFKLLFSELLKIVPLLASIAVISILCGLISQMRSEDVV